MSTIYCMNCGSELEKEARFCTECGSPTKLGLELGLAAPDSDDAIECPVCGVLNNAKNEFCGACTAPLRQEEEAEEAPQSDGIVHHAIESLVEAPKVVVDAIKSKVEPLEPPKAMDDALKDSVEAPKSLLDALKGKSEAPKKRDISLKGIAEAPKNWGASLKGKAKSLDRRRVLKGAVGVLAIMAVLAVGLTVTGFLGKGPFSGLAEMTVKSGDAAQDGDEAENAVPVGSAGVEVRDGLSSYSWEELATIGKEMTRRGTRNRALVLAKEYHLVDNDRHMLDETKDVSIEGYGTVAMRLVDVYHDDLADGEGKAGLTFMAASLPLMHDMNPSAYSEGGWEGSELRSWLGDTIYAALEEDLRTSIVAVSKRTNNVGYSIDASCVTSTTDYLWVPSMVELLGTIDWTWNSDPENSDGFNAITNAEGSQYALFKEHGVQSLETNEILQLKNGDDVQAWWERSCVQSNYEYFRAVGQEGDPTNIWWADDDEVGVPLSFCL